MFITACGRLALNACLGIVSAMGFNEPYQDTDSVLFCLQSNMLDQTILPYLNHITRYTAIPIIIDVCEYLSDAPDGNI